MKNDFCLATKSSSGRGRSFHKITYKQAQNLIKLFYGTTWSMVSDHRSSESCVIYQGSEEEEEEATYQTEDSK